MDLSKAKLMFEVHADAMTWMAVHGNLCLALRHPANRGESREQMIAVIHQLGENLVACGLLTQAEMDDAMRYEFEQGIDFRLERLS